MTTFGDQVFQFGGAAVASDGYPGDYAYTTGGNAEGARTYYVNNITGASTNDGLSWRYPFAQVSQAITASEAHRATLTTNNQYVRNRIFVQGTKTAYTKLTALPLYCDIIGIGADVRGTNDGVPRIGSDTVAESGCVISTTVRGLYVKNIQFQAGKDKYPFQCTNMFRSVFEDCSFMTNGAATGNPAIGFRVTGAIGSIAMRRCFFGSSASIDTEPDIGIKVEGTHFHNCLFEDNVICGKTAGVQIDSACVWNWGSVFKNNVVGDASQTMAIGFDDDSVAGTAHILYCGNYIKATAALDLETDGAARAIGNMAANAFVAAS
jgi:hypothetical protein